MAPLLAALLPTLGKVIDSVVDRVIPDPAKAAEAKAELAKLDLQKMVLEQEEFKAYLADTASARDREAKIATSESAPYINKVIGPYLACAILGSAFILFLCMIFGIDETFGTAQKEIMLYILGVLSAMCTQVVSYYFGSSRGDAAKDQHIRELMKNGH